MTNELLATAGVVCLTIAGVLVHPALGFAVAGVALVFAGVAGAMVAIRTQKKADENK